MTNPCIEGNSYKRYKSAFGLFIVSGLLTGSVLLPTNIGTTVKAAGPTPIVSPTPALKQIYGKALTDHGCDSSEWHFVITQVNSELIEVKSLTVTVTWDNGQTSTLTIEKFTGGVAHFYSYDNLDANVVSVTSTIYSSWSGQFNLSHGPCDNDPHPTATPTQAPITTPTPINSGETTTPTPTTVVVNPVKTPSTPLPTTGMGIKLIVASIVAIVTGMTINLISKRRGLNLTK